MNIINLRSDTQTLPTAAMLAAMSSAPLGDDTYGEDPTTKKLEAMAAGKLGMEAGLLCISGNMANLTALMTHGRPGDEVIIDPDSHIFHYEVGGLANIAGLMPMPVPSPQAGWTPTRSGMLFGVATCTTRSHVCSVWKTPITAAAAASSPRSCTGSCAASPASTAWPCTWTAPEFLTPRSRPGYRRPIIPARWTR